MDILVYSHNLSPRLRYIFKQIFCNILNVNISFTDDKEYFVKKDTPKISYTHRKISNELFFKSSDLMYQKSIIEQDLKVSELDSVKYFYLCAFILPIHTTPPTISDGRIFGTNAIIEIGILRRLRALRQS